MRGASWWPWPEVEHDYNARKHAKGKSPDHGPSLLRVFDLLEVMMAEYKGDRRLATHCARTMGCIAAQFVSSSLFLDDPLAQDHAVKIVAHPSGCRKKFVQLFKFCNLKS